MKKNIILMTVVLLVINYGYAQEATYNAHLANIIPPTPEAFKFTKYGGVPVNESSGIANVNVQIGDYSVGRIKVPISISYQTDGVKVDDMNGFVGMSWNLAAGGMITRTVNDKPDNYHIGDPNTRIFYSTEDLNSFLPEAPYFSEELWNMAQPWFDSEADIFSYSFNGYNGSFIFDQEFIPHLINYNSEVKISLENISNNNIAIHITTPEGIMYSFGGAASEVTMMQSGILGMWSEQAQTSFYLYKITDFNGDQVTFEYDSQTTFRKTIGITQSFTKLVGYGTWNGQTSNCLGENQEYEFLSNKDAGKILQEISGQKTLNRIYSNRTNVQVIFTSTYNSNAEVQRNILNEVKFIDNLSTVQKTIKFSYLGSFSSARQFLSKVEILGVNETTTSNNYTFEYNDINSLPARFSYAQDHLGYYNGKNLNANFIPKVNDALLFIPFNFADRNAYFTYASKGVLTKVTYPTKGFTEFYHESGQETLSLEFVEETKYLSVNYNNPGNTGQITLTSTLNPNPTGGFSTLNPTRPVNISINATIRGYLASSNKVKVTLDDLNSTSDFTFIIDMENLVENPNFPTKTISKNFTCSPLNPSGNYIFKLEYYKTDSLANYPVGSDYLLVNCTVNYATNVPLVKDKLGLRIQKIIDYSEPGKVADYKRYYYNKYSNINNQTDSQVISIRPNYVANDVEELPCLSDMNFHCVPMYKKLKVISSNSVNLLFLPNGAKYEYVTVSYGGENFEAGGKISKFSVEPNTDIQPLQSYSNTAFQHLMFSKYNNVGLNNGTLLSEEVFMLRSGTYTPLQLKTYNYLQIPEKSGYLTNCFATKMFLRNNCARFIIDRGCNCVIVLPIDNYPEMDPVQGTYTYNTRNFYFGIYKTHYSCYNLASTTITEFLTSGNLITTEELFYDSKLAGLPTRKQYTSSDGVAKVLKTYYPVDLPSEAYMQDLIQANRYEPIKTENFVGGIKVSESKTLYAKDASTSNYVLPKYEYAAKFPNNLPSISNIGQLEKKVTYDQYDTNSNLLQYTVDGGVSTSFIWGYTKLYPIAKIENAAISQLTNYVSALQSASNSGTLTQNSFTTLRSALPNAMITTYTYKPLIGIISMSDPKGYRINYEYDTNGRLKFVKDAQYYILSENGYNIKQN